MAMYEYKCEKCGTTYEVLRKVDDRDRPEPCKTNDCGGLATRVNIIRTDFLFRRD